MFYGISRVIEYVDEDDKFDYFLRSRMDWIPKEKINYDNFEKLEENEIAAEWSSNVGFEDYMFFSNRRNMKKVSKIWKDAIHFKNLSPIKINNEFKDLYSHDLLNCFILENNLLINTDLKIERDFSLISEKLVIPFILDDLEKDLNNFDNEE